MINPKELRIGNYVIDKGDGNLYQIPSGSSINLSSEMEAIELTEEWIVKLGIEKDDVGYKIENDNFIFKLLFYDCWNIMYNEKEGYGGSECLIRAFPYVHELQNIFYTLSGQELTIKE